MRRETAGDVEARLRIETGSPKDIGCVIHFCEAMLEEIVLPETKPETEWVRGRALQKMSPTRSHSRLQTEISVALSAWSEGRGEVATEWRFRLAPSGERRRPLVPDVSFVSFERLGGHSFEELELPAFGPNLAVEILSLGDRRRDLVSKIDVYLRSGVELVVVVDPKTRTIEMHDETGTRVVGVGDTFTHSALPGLRLDVGSLFAKALDVPK